MSNTYSQLYIHHISAVKYRNCLINYEIEQSLYKFINGVIRNLDQTPIAVNGMPDHIHILARVKPNIMPSQFVQKIKANSSRWININGNLEEEFRWQFGGATLSVCHSRVKTVQKYIQNQKEHHKNVKFKYEYTAILKKHGIVPDEKWLPDFFDEST